ncbi:MAG: protein kinase [Planctomycetales bacterium]|nr:protein kinase [Planctomycetales bacterium]
MTDLDEAEIFNTARRIASLAERNAYLLRACQSDEAAYRSVTRLLELYDGDREFLETPPNDLTIQADTVTIEEGPGSTIGNYQLLERLGEGGFAVVYLAEQAVPIRRQVALKIIKLGMDTQQVIERFTIERQALAMMDHPGIAQVYDAGATASGRPYFVMQRIVGTPILKYCDQNQLSVVERLQLFVDVCQAVQHAHQKGIIHRDLKPANILVATDQGRPTPKIIDFGIAKATYQRQLERATESYVRQLVGTPLYMSPEQAQLSDIDIDTRSDVYSLGVLLYELVTGTTPLLPSQLQCMSYDEICRAILDCDVPSPSRRLSSLGACAEQSARNRKTNPARLARQLRGDLDWIVMKSLEKNRTDRYETVDAMAQDVERHLTHDPVAARPPSAAYRVRKLARKYRGTTISVALVTAALFFAVAFIVIDRLRIAEQRAIADEQRKVAERRLDEAGKFVQQIVAQTGQLRLVPEADQVRTVKADLLRHAIAFTEAMLQQRPADPEVRLEFGRLNNQLASLNFFAGIENDRYGKPAVAILKDLVTEYPDEPRYRLILSRAHKATAQLSYSKLNWQDCIEHYENAHEHLLRLVGESPDNEIYRSNLFEVRCMLALSYERHGDWKRADKLFRDALDGTGIAGVNVRSRLADLLLSMNQFDEAQLHLEDAMQILSREPAETSWWVAVCDIWNSVLLNTTARHRIYVGEPLAAIDILQSAVDTRAKKSSGLEYSPFYVDVTAWNHFLLGDALSQVGRTDEAIAAVQRSLELWQPNRGRTLSYNAALANFRTGELLFSEGQAEQARAHFEIAKALLEEVAADVPGEEYCQRRLIIFLTHCPDLSFRDPQRALQLAENVAMDSSGISSRWLAWSQYRCGVWREAAASVEHSMQLRSGGDASDWLLLAMIEWQLGQQDQARQTLGRALTAIAEKLPIMYGDLGVLGFGRLLDEATTMVH